MGECFKGLDVPHSLSCPSPHCRGKRLEESLEYQQFVANVEEEEAWINEKLNLVGSEDYGDTLAAVQVRIDKRRAQAKHFV